MKKTDILVFILIIMGTIGAFWVYKQMLGDDPIAPLERPPAVQSTPAPIAPKPKAATKPSPTPNKNTELDKLRAQMLNQLKEPVAKERYLDVPPPKRKPIKKEDKFSRAIEKIKTESPKRVEGITERKTLPLGIILFNQTPIYEDGRWKKSIFQMRTGDFIRVYDNETQNDLIKIHPGADIFLAATSKETEISGTLYPDKPGWVDKKYIHVFSPKEDRSFTQSNAPMTLGNDADFSTFSFYERAFKNRDPVVHRVMAPRFISLLSLHEDYAASWGELLRDPDSKIRSLTLAMLKERGIGNSRRIIEDLIARMAELTQRKAQGEEEVEVQSILALLKSSGHPRVATALESFVETWEKAQSTTLVKDLKATIEATK